jgi:hypothetical protein
MKTSVILFVAGLVVVKSAGTTMRGEHVNNLSFVLGSSEEETGELVLAEASQYLSVNCSEIHHEITNKQPYDGILCNDNVLSVLAGRKSSVDVATAFFNGVPSNGAYMTTFDAYFPPNCAPEPKELNFYVEVGVTFTRGSQNMGTHTLRIGQGHYGGASPLGYGNNWWIEGVGGTLCQRNDGHVNGHVLRDVRNYCGIICKNKQGQRIIFLAIEGPGSLTFLKTIF